MIADEYLLTLLHQGEKLQAVKAYKEETGCSLKEAKDYIDDLEQEMQKNSLRKAPDMQPDEEVLRLIRQGEKLMAVKVFKERTGCDLIVAKDLIDEIYEQIGPKPQPRQTSGYKEWSEQQEPSNLFGWPSRDDNGRSQWSEQRERPLKPAVTKESSASPKQPNNQSPKPLNDMGGHYDKGERNGCLGLLLVLLSPAMFWILAILLWPAIP
ncbi:MAG: hypothetical protein J6Y04_02880 [Bacteroidaceae bacterium]|nr:hypothetical protein [Bacteroidaceae bacterium]